MNVLAVDLYELRHTAKIAVLAASYSIFVVQLMLLWGHRKTLLFTGFLWPFEQKLSLHYNLSISARSFARIPFSKKWTTQ